MRGTDGHRYLEFSHIDQRRLITADEEMGLVSAFFMFLPDGVPKAMKIKVVPGVIEYPNRYGAFDLPAAHPAARGRAQNKTIQENLILLKCGQFLIVFDYMKLVVAVEEASL